jgi:hypothetical protein
MIRTGQSLSTTRHCRGIVEVFKHCFVKVQFVSHGLMDHGRVNIHLNSHFNYKESRGIQQQRSYKERKHAHKPKPSEHGGKQQQLDHPHESHHEDRNPALS